MQVAAVDLPVAEKSRAALTAARVAARYAKAPSYNDLLMADAGVAMRSAESAQGTLQPMLVETSTRAHVSVETLPAPARKKAAPDQNTNAQPDFGFRSEAHREGNQPMASQAAYAEAYGAQPASEGLSTHPMSPDASLFVDEKAREGQSFGIRWEPDMPVHHAELSQTRAREQGNHDPRVGEWWTPGEVSAALRNEPFEVAGTQSMQANLIQFPRELVATRKMRPRLAEGPNGAASETEGQLSIFEVDPRTVSMDVAPAQAMPMSSTASWTGPQWSGIELDAHPWEAKMPATDPVATMVAPRLAPLGWRLMATAADAGLIGAAFVFAAFVTAINMHELPTGKPLELGAAAILLLMWVGYHALFFMTAKGTPGMNYAGIKLCTFGGGIPTRAQLRKRIGATLLSLLPVGFGVVWALFDEDHLSWHDRISQTYLRMR